MVYHYFNVNEVAQALGRTPGTVCKWLRNGKMHGTRTVGGNWLIHANDIDPALAAPDAAFQPSLRIVNRRELLAKLRRMMPSSEIKKQLGERGARTANGRRAWCM